MMNNNSRVQAMAACPKFHKCSANVCPLDPEVEKTKHFTGDRFCYYLLEHAKTGSKASFALKGLEHIHQHITEAIPKLFAASITLKSQYERSSESGSRMGMQPRWDKGE